MTLLAAFKTLIFRHTGQEDLLIGFPIANRNREETESLIGFFANTLVLRTDLSGDPSFSELLTRVRQTSLDAYAHQDVPFERLVEELNPPRDMSRTPVFQIMFAWQEDPGTVSIPGLEVRLVEIEMVTAKFDLTLMMRENGESLRGVLEYNRDLFERETILRLGDHFRVLLEGIAARPDGRISEFPLATGAGQDSPKGGAVIPSSLPVPDESAPVIRENPRAREFWRSS